MPLRQLRQPPQKDYKPEFRELGVDRVRSELLLRRWEPEKLSAARVWVENLDAQNWVAGRADAAPRVGLKWIRKWAMYIAIAFGVAFAAVRLFRTMRWGG